MLNNTEVRTSTDYRHILHVIAHAMRKFSIDLDDYYLILLLVKEDGDYMNSVHHNTQKLGKREKRTL